MSDLLKAAKYIPGPIDMAQWTDIRPPSAALRGILASRDPFPPEWLDIPPAFDRRGKS